MNRSAADGGSGNEHPTLLPWYVAGMLDETASREIQAHVAGCDECGRYVRALESARGTLIRYESESPPRPNPWKPAFVLAASVATAGILLGVFTRLPPSQQAPHVRQVANTVLEPTLRSQPDQGGARLTGTGPWVVTVLLPQQADGGEYRMTLRHRASNELLGDPVAVVPDRAGVVTVLIQSVPRTGEYELGLTPISASAPVHRYPLVVEAPASPDSPP